VLFWKFLKNRYLPPDQRAGGVGPETSRPSNGREVPNFFSSPLPRASSRIKNFFLFARRPLTRPRGHPAAQQAGGPGPVQCGGASRQLGGREVPQPLYKPPLPPNFHFIQQKSEKKREERKRGEEAVKPCSHVGLEVYSRSSRIIT
jgi:hypothetical protein